jgi:glutaconate CoA-transferase subunit B
VDGELTLVSVHPGATVEQARAATQWELQVSEDLRTTEPPSAAELSVLRTLRTKGAGA